MIKVLRKPVSGKYEVIDDFNGKSYKDTSCPVTITVECSWGSEQDGDYYEFHCDDDFKKKLFVFMNKHLKSGTLGDRKQE